MPGSRLPDEGSGAMPRKVAELLRSDERVHESLTRLSSLVKVKGVSSRMVERIVAGSPMVLGLSLAVLRQGICDEEGVSFPDFASALKGRELASVWRAAILAETVYFVAAATEQSGISPEQVYATAWSTAETARWVATKHVVDPDEAFVCGLVLDLGLASMIYALPEVYSAIAHSTEPKPVELFETDSFGFDHATVGAAVLRHYKFPEEAIQQTLIHHYPSQSLDMFGKVMRAATAAVANEGGDNGLGHVPPKLDLAVLEGALLKESDELELRRRAKLALDAALRFGDSAGFRAA